MLFAGDLVVAEQHPNVCSGDAAHWQVVLDEIERLKPERIVTGHGPVGSLETVSTMRDYLSTLFDLAREKGPVGIPSRFRSWEEPAQFAQNLEHLRSTLGAGRDPATRTP